MQIQQNISLKPYNTFNITAAAKYFAAFSSADELAELLASSNHLPQIHRLMVLGGGSNILLTKDFDCLVLKNELKGIDLVKEDDLYYYVKACACENWHRFL